ncbi:hypothetical protein FOZ61_006746 [Perkinsus olseni]|uniref:Uncharacterized protein n=1 Tax=Perkinsus olseni TaxID=32597 RepID=A0A7J6MT36_PEROL|nr:hypothetical protein FOZ61_006746 [Perkinsus olseni]KAF4674749.1 hypothetical protein FOL46_004009 [Perkinsus olseni]
MWFPTGILMYVTSVGLLISTRAETSVDWDSLQAQLDSSDNDYELRAAQFPIWWTIPEEHRTELNFVKLSAWWEKVLGDLGIESTVQECPWNSTTSPTAEVVSEAGAKHVKDMKTWGLMIAFFMVSILA